MIDDEGLQDLRRPHQRPLIDRPTVRLHIDTTSPLQVGGADFNVAWTKVNSEIADEVREILRRHGYTHALLVLDANESFEIDVARREREVAK